MKRSSQLRLTLMVATVPAALVGCDSGPETGAVVQSVEQCTAEQQLSLEDCQAAYQKALAEHERLAPRFQSPNECNDQFGNCAQIQDGQQSYWIPPMTGFLIGYLAGRAGGGGYSYGYAGRSMPLYRSRSGDFYDPRGGYVSGRVGGVKGAVGRASPPARAVTVSRSGFGSSSAARSSFGGGRGFGG